MLRKVLKKAFEKVKDDQKGHGHSTCMIARHRGNWNRLVNVGALAYM